MAGGLVGRISQMQVEMTYRNAGRPGDKLNLVAISGYKGKTIVARALHDMFTKMGVKVGVISSLGASAGRKIINTKSINEYDPAMLFKVLEIMVEEKVQLVFWEISDNFAEAEMMSLFKFAASILTNLVPNPSSPEVNKNLILPIVHTKEKGLVVINGDDGNIAWLGEQAEKIPQKLFAAFCKLEQLGSLTYARNGASFVVNAQKFETKFITDLNLGNLILALRFALQYFPADKLVSVVSQLQTVEGKFQHLTRAAGDSFDPSGKVLESRERHVVIDATPDEYTLGKVLYSVKKLTKGKLISVIGADSEENKYFVGAAAQWSQLLVLAPQSSGALDISKFYTQVVQAAEEQKLRVQTVEVFNSAEEFALADIDKLEEKIMRVNQNGDIPAIIFDEPDVEARRAAISLCIQLANPEDTIVFTGVGDKRELHLGEIYHQWDESDEVGKMLLS